MARRTFMRGGRQVREILWLPLTEGRDTLVSANSALLTNSLNAAGLALRPFTVIRSIVYWSIRSDQFATSENFAAAIGLAVVSDQAAAIGVTAIPTPFTDLGSDLWLLHAILDGHFLDATTVGFDSIGVSPAGGQLVDSRAMRKVNGDQDVIFAVENDSTGQGSIVYSAGRILIKLH